jgi:hypothetical protein
MSDTTLSPDLLRVINLLGDVSGQKLYREDLCRLKIAQTLRRSLQRLQFYLATLVEPAASHVLCGL